MGPRRNLDQHGQKLDSLSARDANAAVLTSKTANLSKRKSTSPGNRSRQQATKGSGPDRAGIEHSAAPLWLLAGNSTATAISHRASRKRKDYARSLSTALQLSSSLSSAIGEPSFVWVLNVAHMFLGLLPITVPEPMKPGESLQICKSPSAFSASLPYPN